MRNVALPPAKEKLLRKNEACVATPASESGRIISACQACSPPCLIAAERAAIAVKSIVDSLLGTRALLSQVIFRKCRPVYTNVKPLFSKSAGGRQTALALVIRDIRNTRFPRAFEKYDGVRHPHHAHVGVTTRKLPNGSPAIAVSIEQPPDYRKTPSKGEHERRESCPR
jgi:hypothetical protein